VKVSLRTSDHRVGRSRHQLWPTSCRNSSMPSEPAPAGPFSPAKILFHQYARSPPVDPSVRRRWMERHAFGMWRRTC
jgi:hypothetical protein